MNIRTALALAAMGDLIADGPAMSTHHSFPAPRPVIEGCPKPYGGSKKRKSNKNGKGGPQCKLCRVTLGQSRICMNRACDAFNKGA